MKRILSLILGLVIAMSSLSMTAFAANDDVKPQVKADVVEDAYARLSAVGITLEGNALTAGDFIATLLKFSNPEAKNNDDTFEMARGMGLVNSTLGRTQLINYRDALNAALMFAGYKQVLEMNDVMSVASSADLVGNITAGEKDNITRDAAAVLLSDLLDVEVMQYSGSSYKSDGTTVLNKYFKMTKKRVEIVQVNRKENKIFVRENGETVVYYGADNLNYDRVSAGNQLVFINEENAICYVKTSGKGFMFWDFVYTVNKNKDQSINYYIDQLDKMTFYNSGEEYDVSEDVIAFYGDEATENSAYPICGAFVKVFGYDNEITQLNIYSLTEGGLLKTFTGTSLSYTQGSVNDLVSGDIASVQDMTVIIDGREKTLEDLKKNMVFDYWSNDDETSMLIVASSRKAVGEIKSYGTSTVKIADLHYNVSSNVYSYNRYMAKYEPGFTLRPPTYVEAYIDDRCEIRYVRDNQMYDNLTTVYGFVKKAWVEDNGEDRGIKIIPITGPGSGNEIIEHKVKKKLNSGSLSFEYVQSVQSDLNGKGFLKFTINADDVVVKIEPVENMTSSISFSMSGDKNAKGYQGFYMNDATMMVVYPIDGEFNVKTLTWKTFWSYYDTDSPKLTLTVDYHPTQNPIPKFGLVTGDTHLIEPGWNAAGFVSVCEQNADGDYTVKIANTTYTLDADTVETHGIKEGVYAQLRIRPFMKNGLIYFEDPSGGTSNDATSFAKYSKVIDLSGPISTWSEKLNDVFGPFEESQYNRLALGKVILKGDNYIQFEVDGKPTSVYPITENLRVSEIVDSEPRVYRDAPTGLGNNTWYTGSQALRNVRIGDRVMFLVRSTQGMYNVQNIYYFDDGSVFGGR